MPLRVNTNISAFNSKRILGNNTKDLSLRIERLSSGGSRSTEPPTTQPASAYPKD